MGFLCIDSAAYVSKCETLHDVGHALTGGRSCWFIFFSPVFRQPSIQSMLKDGSEMEWGHPVGKQLHSDFDFHCFVFMEKQTILLLR